VRAPLAAVIDVLNEPRKPRHLPLASRTFADESAAAWVAAKDSQWESNGYAPWAELVNGEFAGWGGFQRKENGADLALVPQEAGQTRSAPATFELPNTSRFSVATGRGARRKGQVAHLHTV
jgi:hypothetical protein